MDQPRGFARLGQAAGGYRLFIPSALLCGLGLVFISSTAMAQDGSFFTDDVFIEEDVMIEGAFESGFVTETYEESIEDDDEAESMDEQDTEDE